MAAEIISDYARALRKTKEPDEYLEMVAEHFSSIREKELQRVQDSLIRLRDVVAAKLNRIETIVQANTVRLQSREKEINPTCDPHLHLLVKEAI